MMAHSFRLSIPSLTSRWITCHSNVLRASCRREIPSAVPIAFGKIRVVLVAQAPPIWQESFTRNIFLGICLNRGETLARRYSGRRPWGIGTWTRQNSSKNPCKRSVNATKEWTFDIPRSRWYRKIVGKRTWIPRIHSEARTTCKEWRSQWRTSRGTGRGFNRQNPKMTLKPEMTSGWSKVTSSIVITMNFVFNSCAERRIISNSTKVYWRDQDNLHKSGCVARKTQTW